MYEWCVSPLPLSPAPPVLLCLFLFVSWNLAQSRPKQTLTLNSLEMCLPWAQSCQGLMAGNMCWVGPCGERFSGQQDLLRSQRSE